MLEELKSLPHGAVWDYYCLTRAQIQRLCLPQTDSDGRAARRRLSHLLHLGLLNQTRGEKLEVVLQQSNTAQPGTLTGSVIVH